MAALRIEPRDDSPLVILNREKEQFEISGKSMPEDVVDFYTPVLEWLNDYKADPLENTEFNFKLIYFNTASSKLILDVLMILEEISENGHNAKVKWHYMESDEDMLEAGEEYAEMVELPFEYQTFK